MMQDLNDRLMKLELLYMEQEDMVQTLSRIVHQQEDKIELLEKPLELLPLKGYIDSFFDNVKVMAEEENMKNNRLALHKRVENLFRKFGDFNEIVIKEGDDVSR